MSMQRFASNLLTGWDVDKDGKLELQEVVYVLDEFCGEICFECRCPQIHARPMVKKTCGFDRLLQPLQPIQSLCSRYSRIRATVTDALGCLVLT